MKGCELFRSARICGISVFLCLMLATTISIAEPTDALDSVDMEEVSMVIGELVTLKVYSMTRVSIADPDVADIVDANDNELLLIGRIVGKTAMFLWDEYGKRTIIVHVLNEDLNAIKDRIESLLKTVEIYEVKAAINEQEGKVVISGEIPGDKQILYENVIEKFYDAIIDFTVPETIEDLIQIDMQITELNTTLQKSLGINWSTGGTAGIAPAYVETPYSSDGHIRDFFKIGEFNRTGALLAAVDALIVEGKGRVLSKPKIVVKNGNEASFLVGGEIPIRTTTSSGVGTTQENVTFREFGISMSITPTIEREHIDIVLNLEVSEVDASTASTVSDTVAFSTRSASTHLYLEDSQTIVLAGLIKKTDSESQTRIPFVSDIPILGLLFRNKANPVANIDQELVIALTPHVMPQRDLSGEKDKTAQDNQKVSQKGYGDKNFSRRNAAPYYLGIPKEMTGYVHDVQQKISKAIMYPREAEKRGWEGTVKLGVLILKDGTLAFALVKESSGRDIFDELALNTARELAPFMAFPSDTDLQELNVTIPIVYSLKNN